MQELELAVLPYPEEIPEDWQAPPQYRFFVPDQLHVVMGASGKPAQEVLSAPLLREGIPLYKRRGGGGTVLLGPHCVVLTVHARVAHLYHNLRYFSAINRALMTCLEPMLDCSLEERGISDIACAGKKIVGSSIFRRKYFLLYQASILIDLPIETIQRVLAHPPKEPDYRQNRSHRDFLTCLKTLGYSGSATQCAETLQAAFGSVLPKQLELADV
ncbi:MAG: hypothetical protein H6510_01040 [Acidobacteria bacterium]|nr:hypothetical protein [Acidobacteriota bacterium]MCB9396374.1 hypothetical protein [Acidobacteriota bacterium]